MQQSRIDRIKEKIRKSKEIEIPKKVSDHCIGECDVKVIGFDEKTKKPIIYCFGGCGRKLGK